MITAKDGFNQENKMKSQIVHVLNNCIQRSNALTLEQKQDGALKSIPLSDLIPDEWKDKYQNLKITVTLIDEK